MQRPSIRRVIMGSVMLLIVLFTLLIIAMQIGGQQNLPSKAMQSIDPGSCSQPCWHGIQIGKTTIKQAESLLKSDSAFNTHLYINDPNKMWPVLLEWQIQGGPILSGGSAIPQLSDDPNSPVESLYLYPSSPASPLLLGDAIRVFGEPIGFELCWRTDTMDAHVHFANHIEAAVGTIYVAMGNHAGAFDPNMTISIVTYHPVNKQPYRRELRPWQGFKTPSVEGWHCQE